MKNLSLSTIELKLRWLYPVWILVSIFSIAYVPSLIFKKGDILKTAANVSEYGLLFRLSIIGSFITAVLMVYVSYNLYLLFERVNKNSAKLMLILALLSVPFVGFDAFKILASNSTDADSIYTFLSVGRNAQIVAEVFWGLWLFPLAKLVIESKFFPKFLGFALYASCFGYLLGVFLKVVFPNAGDLLLIVDILAFGEVVFALWFIFMGLRLR